jgi:hypothetical protein
VIIRPATADDIATFSDLPSKPSIRAWVAEQDGKLLGMGGVVFSQGRWLAFVDLTDDLRPHKIAIARTAIRFLAECRRSGIRFIYAEADTKEPGASRWLTSLGFEIDPRKQYLYRWRA